MGLNLRRRGTLAKDAPLTLVLLTVLTSAGSLYLNLGLELHPCTLKDAAKTFAFGMFNCPGTRNKRESSLVY